MHIIALVHVFALVSCLYGRAILRFVGLYKIVLLSFSRMTLNAAMPPHNDKQIQCAHPAAADPYGTVSVILLDGKAAL